MCSHMKLSAREKNKVMERLSKARTALLIKEPFYGNLLMNLKLVLEECGTACTDMEYIFFDPAFARDLSDEDLVFVMKHEVLHCVLQHCVRFRNHRNRFLYNYAADIVVNSHIMKSMKVKDYYLSGDDLPLPHIALDGREGCECTTEEIYYDLLLFFPNGQDFTGELSSLLDHYHKARVDSHDRWNSVTPDSPRAARWKKILTDTFSRYGHEAFPEINREWMEGNTSATVDWRACLSEFVQLSATHMDYTFQPADRRFSEEGFILPSFHSMDYPENLWFLVDTSGSISEDQLNRIYNEIDEAMKMIPGLSGRISFFDTRVTDPVPFSSREDLRSIMPEGWGGTSFKNIFKYMQEKMSGDLPSAVIIMTDGWAPYPGEEQAMGVPVLWILMDQSSDAPWGRSIHID